MAMAKSISPHPPRLNVLAAFQLEAKRTTRPAQNNRGNFMLFPDEYGPRIATYVVLGARTFFRKWLRSLFFGSKHSRGPFVLQRVNFGDGGHLSGCRADFPDPSAFRCACAVCVWVRVCACGWGPMRGVTSIILTPPHVYVLDWWLEATRSFPLSWSGPPETSPEEDVATVGGTEAGQGLCVVDDTASA